MRQFLTGFGVALTLATSTPAWAQGDMSTTERADFRAEVRAYLLDNPEILTEMISLLEERQKAAASAGDLELVSANADAIFDDGFSFVGGNPEGSVTVVEFTDYQCGFCKRAHPEVKDLVEQDGDIRLIVKEMPILGPGSELGARAAIATLIEDGPDAYARLNDALMSFEGQVTDESLSEAFATAEVDAQAVRAQMDSDEVTRRLDETRRLADALEISGTPTFVFGNQMVRGYVPVAGMRDLVAELRSID